jgi:hypothetical protein
VNVDQDILARMAIRLGRAFNHSWAKDIPKSVPWSWDMASYYADISKAARKPVFDPKQVEITYDHSNSHWLFSQTKVEVEFYNRHHSEFQGFVRLGLDALGSHYVHARVEDWTGMTDAQVWRMDRAINSLSTGPWASLYSLPPLAVLTKVLPAPKAPVNLYYRTGSDGTATMDLSSVHVGEEERMAFVALDKAFTKFKAEGGLTRWDRLVMKELKREV